MLKLSVGGFVLPTPRSPERLSNLFKVMQLEGVWKLWHNVVLKGTGFEIRRGRSIFSSATASKTLLGQLTYPL